MRKGSSARKQPTAGFADWMLRNSDLFEGSETRLKTLWLWHSAASFLFGKRVMIRQTYRPWRACKQPGFHPDQLASDLSCDWLQHHADAYSVIGSVGPIAQILPLQP